jgi:hypothetical protein
LICQFPRADAAFVLQCQQNGEEAVDAVHGLLSYNCGV